MTNPIKLINGYECRTCNECKRDINLNSMKNENICNTCYQDITEISIWEVVEGDYNDVYSRNTIRATNKQMEKYVLDQFSDDPKIQERIQDLNMDSIGYGIWYENEIDPDTGEEYEDQELRLEYYVEAVYIDRDGDNETYNIDIDLTEKNKEIEE